MDRSVTWYVDVFQQFGARRRMFVLDDSYSTAAGFITGVDVATAGELLGDGFNEYVASRLGGSPSIFWPSLVAEANGSTVADLPREKDDIATAMAVQLVLDFLERPVPVSG